MHDSKLRLSLAAALLLPLAACSTTEDVVVHSAAAAPSYPDARRGDVTYEHHGVTIADPYRWLEDPDSAESRAWIEAQNELTSSWLAEVPGRMAWLGCFHRHYSL